MRLTRLIIGFLVILVAVLVIAGEQLSGASADAVINARLTTLRAPIAGTLSMQRRPLGSSLTTGESIASVRDTLVDDIRLNDLVLEQGTAAAEVARLEATIAAVETARAEMEARFQDYAAERLRHLETMLPAAANSPEVPAPGEGQAARRAAEIALETARRGIFLGPGYDDAPYSAQQVTSLSLRIAELTAQLDAERARAAAIDQRIDAERLRVNRLGTAELVSNIDGRVWEVLAGDGETVQRGQDVMRLVDCQSTIVTLSVSEAVYNRLSLGDAASFRINDDGRSFQGTVIRLAGSGSGAETIYRNLAIAPSARHLQRYDVTLLSLALREDAQAGCAIGRTGRAFFEARPLDFLRRIWN